MSAVLKPLALELRPMNRDDLEWIIRVERASYPYPWTQGNFSDCLDSGYSCWVGEVDGRPMAYWVMMLAVGIGEGHVLNCCVAPQWQGRGLGRQLMEHLLQVAREYQTELLYLEVRPSNTHAVRLYERLGFEGIALRRNYYPADEGREDALVMRLRL
jgi:ribosomal-protein-alanine N-acetyltransferase